MISSLLNTFTSTLAASSSEGGEGNPFDQLFSHVVPQTELFGFHLPEIFGMQIWNITIFQVLSILMIFLFFGGVRNT